MTPEQRDELRARFGTLIRFDVPLSGLSTYRIGGPAAAVLEPKGAEDVARGLAAAVLMGITWMPLGLGSNILAPDVGFDGLVIRMGKGMATVSRDESEPTIWTVGAGMPIPLLAKQTAAAGMSGVHRLIGVPGTVGGGVFMNAGAHGQEFRDVVTCVDVAAPDGNTSRMPAEEIRWRYRSWGLEGLVVTLVRLAFTPEDPADLERDIIRYLRWRKSGTPFDQPCCGSVFRNPTDEQLRDGAMDVPEPFTAGRLIDAAGLKGFAVGGAKVSEMHANYIVNTGTASAADVLAVIDGVRAGVLERFGIDLECEVKLLDMRNRDSGL